MMKEKLKVGVFGGGRGLTMMNVLLDHPDARLVAVCDKYQPSLDKVSQMAKEKNADVATYTNFDDFIRHDMDAVVLANYAHEHALYAVKCLDAGKHVLSEVLPCGTIAQGVALIEAVEKSGTPMPKITVICSTISRCGTASSTETLAISATRKANMSTIAPRSHPLSLTATLHTGATKCRPISIVRTALGQC